MVVGLLFILWHQFSWGIIKSVMCYLNCNWKFRCMHISKFLQLEVTVLVISLNWQLSFVPLRHRFDMVLFWSIVKSNKSIGLLYWLSSFFFFFFFLSLIVGMLIDSLIGCFVSLQSGAGCFVCCESWVVFHKIK